MTKEQFAREMGGFILGALEQTPGWDVDMFDPAMYDEPDGMYEDPEDDLVSDVKEEKPLSSYNFDNDQEYQKLLKLFCNDENLAKYWHIKHLGLDKK